MENGETILYLPKEFPKTSIICTIGPSVFRFDEKDEQGCYIRRNKAGRIVGKYRLEVKHKKIWKTTTDKRKAMRELGTGDLTRDGNIVYQEDPGLFRKNRIGELIDEGMTIARINFSWAETELGYSYTEIKILIRVIRDVSRLRRIPVGIMMDLKGPEIRIGNIKEIDLNALRSEQKTENPRVILKKLKPSARKKRAETCEDLRIPTVPVTYEGDFYQDATRRDDMRIFIDDGDSELTIVEKRKDSREIVCEVVYGERLRARKGITLWGAQLGVKPVGKEDRKALAQRFDVDYIAQSFVRKYRDIKEDLYKELVRRYGDNWQDKVKIIAKIETPVAKKKDEMKAILESDLVYGIMVARGDLGVQISFQEVPEIQADLIDKANRLGKPVIVATQMLDSMVLRAAPTRAEVQDITTAVIQGADAIMLSAETASGKYPIKSVQTAKEIVMEVEDFDRDAYRQRKFDGKYAGKGDDLIDVLGHPICELAEETSSPVIVSYATTGATSSKIAKFRPLMPILVLMRKKHVKTAYFLLLHSGLYPVVLNLHTLPRKKSNEFIKRAKRTIVDLDFGVSNSKDKVVGTLMLGEAKRFREQSRAIYMFRL